MACFQETRWVGNRAREADGFKLWYSGRVRGKNGVRILVNKDLRELMVEVKKVGLDEEVKRRFWEDLDGLVRGIPSIEKLIIRGDFNGHIGRSPGGYDGVHGGFDFGDRNGGVTSLLEYAKAFELVITNSCFPKKAEQLITFWRRWPRPRLIIYFSGNVIEVYARIARSSRDEEDARRLEVKYDDPVVQEQGGCPKLQ
ncbi:PREDICTED: uncharacterized protein LOC109245046 [Nicotiana attenuata]|uniref:uncharacterized protein LOC109245046 n=1 Tax=Nicotiana attenuata TaxID=49451 RepID=UPI0009050EBB|nr:PREDICTED: uncharacterized protein LOC109245046 [Nicotiana attenuata]